MSSPMAALATAAAGVVASLVGLVAQADGSGSSDIASFVSGGGAVAAVGALVYIARLMAAGKLIAVDTKAQADALKAMADAYHADLLDTRRREDRAVEREQDYRDALLVARRGSIARKREVT